MKSEEVLSKSSAERSSLDRGLKQLEDENVDLQRQTGIMQQQLAQLEQEHQQRYVLLISDMSSVVLMSLLLSR
jgi:ABC-type phosphate transport system auxiliary subunit